jgi:hypothetical protein
VSIDPAILKAMQAAGASIDVIIAAVEADAAIEEKRRDVRRANNAERQRRFKAKRKTVVTSGNADNALPSVTGSPKDIYIQTPSEPLSANADSPPLADRVVSAWNEGPAKSGCTAAIPLNQDRIKHLRARIREHGEQSVFEAIGNLGRSDFHCGKNDRCWKANLGWLLKSPENFQKALELRPTEKPPPSGPGLAALLHQAQRYAPREQAA